VTFGEGAFVQSIKTCSHAGMNEGWGRLDDNRDLIVVLVTEPVEGHLVSFD
jgi:hypothetical protein